MADCGFSSTDATMRHIFVIVAALASLLSSPVAQAVGRCRVMPLGCCVELSGVSLREPGRLTRYAVRNLGSNQADTVHTWFIPDYSRAYPLPLPAGATNVFTVTTDAPYGAVGDVMVQASQPISIELLNPVYPIYMPALMRPIHTPAPTPSPQPPIPPDGVPWCAGSTGTTRMGAICNDGFLSSATGSGACSGHGGVACWIGR